ncbi:RNA polymerase II-associated [Lentinus brumalis]|uniref:RNA polymerase II-associated n=1 Tax=Lentinus brumalis TaxID=2498619 RepID=A0A371DPA2_9APHY|nr:RNA polymerase II-associated [Polyporus brumalis]
MSYKKSKLELLIRVRYQNPLPAPPCPPKLLDIPTDPKRYARPEFLDDIAAGTPLPMVVDGELGMPLDLSRWDCLWDESGDDSEINPDPKNLPKLDPKDQFLLGDPATSSGAFLGAGPSSGAATPLSSVPHVAWLRKTEYLSRDGSSRASLAQDVKQNMEATIDVSRDAQLRDIEASFAAVESSELANLRHPTKPELTAVEAFDILPDADIWANAYDLFRFSERPGDRPPDVDDPRLDCAILRPMEADGDHFLAYYLAKDDEDAIAFKQNRLARSPDDPPEEEPSAFHFVRDYETVKVEQEVPNEFLLVLDEGSDPFDADNHAGHVRPKGAYYKNIERKMLLKKKRVNTYESYGDKWDVVKLRHVPMSREEEQEREEALAEVVDPLFPLSRADADADGEGEVDDAAGAANGASSRNAIADAIDVFGE